IADGDFSVIEDLAEGAAAPGDAHRVLQARDRLFHLDARPRLAVDANANVPDLQDLSARGAEVDVGDQEIGAPQPWIGGIAERRGHLAPVLVRDDGDLALAALIGVADDALAGDDLRALSGIHRPAMHALDPALFEPAHDKKETD